MLKIEFYKTVLCPRCLYVAHQLKKITAQQPHIEVETIEIAKNLSRARAAGIRTVPSLKIGDDTLSDLLITPAKLQHFIEQHPAP